MPVECKIPEDGEKVGSLKGVSSVVRSLPQSEAQVKPDQSCLTIPDLPLPTHPPSQPTEVLRTTESPSWATGDPPSPAPAQEESTTSLATETFRMTSRSVWKQIPHILACKLTWHSVWSFREREQPRD